MAPFAPSDNRLGDAFKATRRAADAPGMDLLVAAAVVLAAIIVAIRWAKARPLRAVPLGVALAATVVFVVIRNDHNLEDTAFLWALLAVCVGAAVTSAVISLVTTRSARDAIACGALAGVLVPSLFIGWIVVDLTSCLITSCDQS